MPDRNKVWQLIQKFRETGSAFDDTRFGKPSILIQDKVFGHAYETHGRCVYEQNHL